LCEQTASQLVAIATRSDTGSYKVLYHHTMYVMGIYGAEYNNKGNNKITELRTILQRESQNS
jgi:hypothetical protein